MTIARQDVPQVVSDLLDGRPARWASGAVGDYDGRERTLEVFDANAAEQLTLLRKLRSIRAELRAAVQGPLVIVFHTRAESERLYKGFMQTWRQHTHGNPGQHCRVSSRWVDVVVREGEAVAPRKAA